MELLLCFILFKWPIFKTCQGVTLIISVMLKPETFQSTRVENIVSKLNLLWVPVIFETFSLWEWRINASMPNTRVQLWKHKIMMQHRRVERNLYDHLFIWSPSLVPLTSPFLDWIHSVIDTCIVFNACIEKLSGNVTGVCDYCVIWCNTSHTFPPIIQATIFNRNWWIRTESFCNHKIIMSFKSYCVITASYYWEHSSLTMAVDC